MSASAQPLYHDIPLGEYIRVLDLLPGVRDEPLIGKLRIAELGKSPYIALSYVCGNTTLARSIAISSHTLGIYNSTFEILTRFRHPSETVTVWIDCICINQNDAREKEREVGVMWKIYEHAAACNIWLGPGDADSKAAMNYARTLDAEVYQAEYSPYLEFGSGYWERKSHILDLLADQDNKEALINAGAKFLIRPWFTRVWCTQEGAVSVNTLVYCGSDCVPWIQVFALAWIYLPRWTMRWPDWFTTDYSVLETNLFDAINIQRYRLRRTYVETGHHFTPTSGLVSVLQSCAWRLKCYDPRDKIYAMRNIASDAKDALDDWTPKPDYTIPWRELYTSFAVTLAQRGDKDVLYHSGTLRHGHDAGLQSWVPDWRAFPWTQYLNHNEWAAGSKRPLTVKMNRIPKKRARKLLSVLPGCPSSSLRQVSLAMSIPILMQDQVSYLSDVCSSWNRSQNLKACHSHVIRIEESCLKHIHSLETGVYFTSETLVEAYNKTLIANTTDQDTLASDSYTSEGVSAWRSWLREGADPTNTPRYHEAIDSVDTFDRKQFCVTKQGYFCLVPAETQPNDILAIVKGMEMPFVLRPVADCYLYIGNSYIHGMMENQATGLIEEFSIKIRDGRPVWKPEGDVRRNGLSLDVGEYKRILDTLGDRWIELV